MEHEMPVDTLPSQGFSLTSSDNDIIGAPNVTVADEMVVLKGEAPTTSVTDEESENGSPRELVPNGKILTDENFELSKNPGPDDHIPTLNDSTNAIDNIDEMETSDKRSRIEDRQTLSSEAPPKNTKTGGLSGGLIDTAAPFESVKEAVSKFGGIVDWKAHRIQTAERCKLIDQELEHAQLELPEYTRRWEAAEEEKLQVLKELDSTKRHIEELKLNLEKAETEEHQAKQDSELGKLRIEEMEQGIAGEESVAAIAQLEVAKARYTAAASELRNVREELQALRKEYASLVTDNGDAQNRADEAVYACKEIEKTVEELTIELIATKNSLESANVSRMEAEEKRIGAAMARDQDLLTWEKELKQTEGELQSLNEQILSEKDLKSKLNAASTLLVDLKSELTPDMECHRQVQAAIAAAKQELEEVKLNIEKETEKVNDLMVAAIALKSELEHEKSTVSTLTQREGMASVAVESLQAEVDETKTKTAEAQKRVAEVKEKMVQLPNHLQQAVQEADEAKTEAQMASEMLRKIEIETDHAKAGVSTIMSRIFALKKETEAAKASENLALAAIKALQESELARNENHIDSHAGVTLSLEEYYELSKRAHDAEERAAARVALSSSQIEVAQESETKSLEKLEGINREMAARKEELKLAMAKAEKAQEGKLGVEQELRKWRAENEERRKNSKASQEVVSSERTSLEGKKEAPNEAMDRSNDHGYSRAGSLLDTKAGKKKKRSFFPRVLMFLARRKAHPNKPT